MMSLFLYWFPFTLLFLFRFRFRFLFPFPFLFQIPVSGFSRRPDVPYNMKFSRHVGLAILMCAYFTTLKFRDFAKILYFVMSLN